MKCMQYNQINLMNRWQYTDRQAQQDRTQRRQHLRKNRIVQSDGLSERPTGTQYHRAS